MPPRSYALLALLILGGCATPDTAYDAWRDFHLSVQGMDAAARAEKYARINALNELTPTAMTRLQAAYLRTLDGPPSAEARWSEIGALLDAVDDGYELVPVRDMLRQFVALQQVLARRRQELEQLSMRCAGAETRLLALRQQQAEMRREIDTCTEQLEALKEIESMMSAADVILEM